jgi:hypothetical protein
MKYLSLALFLLTSHLPLYLMDENTQLINTARPISCKTYLQHIGFGAFTGSLIGAGIAKFCPCKRQESE